MRTCITQWADTDYQKTVGLALNHLIQTVQLEKNLLTPDKYNCCINMFLINTSLNYQNKSMRTPKQFLL